MKPRNPVARHLNKFNRPATQRDRRKAERRGYRKHKGDSLND